MTKRKPTAQAVKAIDKAGEEIERARAQLAESKQPRFMVNPKQARRFLQQIYNIGKDAIFNEPVYNADSGRRDAWLAKVVKKEPYLLGVLQSVVSIDKNRGWTLTGGKIQVKKFVNILHNFQVAADLHGWRSGLSVTSQNFYQSDLGGVVEIGRTMEDGPLAALYTVDPTQCRLTGDPAAPLRYVNNPADLQLWSPNDYFRVSSFPSTSESMNGLGYCAVSRCIELAKLMVSVIEHDREQLGSKAPKGILTIKGVSQEQWLASLEDTQVELKQLEREYYTGVQVLANELQDIQVNLTPLSTLPENFNHEQYIDMIMFGYALAFGYDPREFWPVSGGSLGTGRETEAQHRKATSKGGLDFALGFQEKLQDELPETLQFEFEQRDVEGDVLEAELKAANLDIIRGMYEAVNTAGVGLVSYTEARQLLVDAGLIPEGWTPEEEDVQIADTDDMDAVLESEPVQRAMEKFPDQEIVTYNERTGKYRTVYNPNKRTFKIRMRETLVKRADYGTYDAMRLAYQDAIFTAVSDYLKSSDRVTSYRSAMASKAAEVILLAAEFGYIEGGGELPFDDEEINDWIASEQAGELANIDSLFVSLKMLRDGGDFDANAEGEARAEGYANTLDAIYSKAMLFGAKNKMITWQLGATEKHCETCSRLDGQRHKASWWIGRDYIPRQPGSDTLECGGWNCDCALVDDDGNEYTL